jgi:phosphatidylglycerophosphate synthase
VFDSRLRPLIDPPLAAAAAALERTGLSANALTVAGLAAGLGAATAIASQAWTAALALVACNRLLDGLDGALARRRGPTDFGGYLDALCDFAFYAAVPLAFAIADPGRNALPAATLLASFLGTGASFLGFAAVAARRGLATETQGRKSIYYLAGLAEGGETIAVFVAFCLWPQRFPAIAYGFAALCAITVLARLRVARELLDASGRANP